MHTRASSETPCKECEASETERGTAAAKFCPPECLWKWHGGKVRKKERKKNEKKKKKKKMMGMLMVTPFHLSEWKVKIKRANALCVGDFSKEKRRVEDGFRSVSRNVVWSFHSPAQQSTWPRCFQMWWEEYVHLWFVDLKKFDYVLRYDERYVHL